MVYEIEMTLNARQYYHTVADRLEEMQGSNAMRSWMASPR